MEAAPMILRICMLLPSSNLLIPIRTQLAEVYGGYFAKKGHAIFAVVSSTQAREYDWEGVRVYEVVSCRKLGKLRLAERVIKENRCNLIQVRNSSLDGMFGLYLRWKYGIPVVFQYTWPVIEYLREESKLGGDGESHFGGVIEMLDDFLQMKVMDGADLILPISRWMTRYLVSRGLPRDKMLAFPDGVNPNIFFPENSGSEKRREYGLGSSPLIAYVGTLDRLRRLDFLIRTFRRVKSEIINAKLLMVGDGNDRSSLEKLEADLELCEDIVFTGKVKYSEVPSFLAASDVTVSPIPPSNLYKVSSPLKVFEYMGAGRPVVANWEVPEQEEVIRESGGGLCVPYDEESFASAIIELLKDSDKRQRMGMNGRKWVIENRTYEKLGEKIEEAYFDLWNTKG